MNRGFIAAGVLLGLLAAATVLAGEPRERHRRGAERMEEMTAIPGLNLSAEQAERMAALREAHLAESRPLREKLGAQGRELRKLWLAQTPDRERITALQAEVQALRVQLNGKVENYRQAARRMLTPEQQDRLAAFERERHHQRMMRGGPPDGGPPEGRGMMTRGTKGGR